MEERRSLEVTVPSFALLAGITRVQSFFNELTKKHDDTDNLIIINQSIRDCAYQLYIILTIVATIRTDEKGSEGFKSALKSSFVGINPRLKAYLRSMLEKERIGHMSLSGNRSINEAIRKMNIWS